jgi:hypothetical protein
VARPSSYGRSRPRPYPRANPGGFTPQGRRRNLHLQRIWTWSLHIGRQY